MREAITSVLVELKAGFGGDHAKSAACMQSPIPKAKDTHVNRHFARHGVTLHLFRQEADTRKLLAKGIDKLWLRALRRRRPLRALHLARAWWERRAARIVERISWIRAFVKERA